MLVKQRKPPHRAIDVGGFLRSNYAITPFLTTGMIAGTPWIPSYDYAMRDCLVLSGQALFPTFSSSQVPSS